MTTNTTEAQLKAAAAKLQSEDPTLQPERAEQLARLVMEAASEKIPSPAGKPTPEPAPAPKPAPATRPAAPRIDVAALAGLSPAEKYAAWRAHEKNLASWLDTQQSYSEPISEEAQAAKARLLEMRAQSEAATDLEKVRRAMEKERLHSIILANGMARL